jgi:hypothetical protein
MSLMTEARIGLRIELRPTDGRGDQGAFATVSADRITFDDDTLTASRDGVAVARYPLDSVAALYFGTPTATALPASVSDSSAVDTINAIDAHAGGELEPSAMTALDGRTSPTEAVAPTASGTGWTPGEDALLRTLSDQRAGLTMMIIKTQRPIAEVTARLHELGIDPVGN